MENHMSRYYLDYRTKVGCEHVTLPYYFEKVVTIERCVNEWKAGWIWWHGGHNNETTCQLTISHRIREIRPYRTITWNHTESWLGEELTDPDQGGLRRIDSGFQNYTVITRWRDGISSS